MMTMMLHRNRLRIFLLASALSGIAVVASPVVHAATVVVVNGDGAGEGFNDPTSAAPVGGNTGTTVGAQRLIAFQRAADIWGARLSSAVAIRVRGQFDPLSCTASSGTLGSAGASNFFRDFAGAPVANTWFPVALANALRGVDNDPAGDDINATFNSNVGTAGCLSSSGWYYGLDGNAPSNRIDFVTVLLHELGHGLGFATIVDLSTGAKALGFNDTYMRNLENHGASPSDYPSMSNAQRVTASTATGNLHWVGANVRAASGVLSAGNVGDHVRMYAPNPQEPGSSVSHWDTALTPNQLMEPFITGTNQTPSLELPLFQDIGWTLLGGGGSGTSIVAAVAPTARSTIIGSGVTAYATIINAGSGTADNCSIALPGGVSATFLYQATNSSGSPIGTPNNSVSIAPGQAQGFYFLITPTVAMQQNINLVFDCTNTNPAPVYPGINQFRLTAAATQSADVLMASATAPDFGLMNIPNPNGSGFFAVAAVNIGPSASITFTPTYTPIGESTRSLPLASSICHINPSNGQCITPATPSSSVTLTVDTGQVVNFGVFVNAQGTFIPLDLVNNRVFVVAQQGSTPLSQTSVAVRMLSSSSGTPVAQAAPGQ